MPPFADPFCPPLKSFSEIALNREEAKERIDHALSIANPKTLI
jgi:hypothetical protein